MAKESLTPGLLRNAPLVEVLLELRFKQIETFRGYGAIPGQIYERLKGTYPQAEDLEASQFPLLLAPSPVRHRFSTPDGARLFQVGNGVVSFNDLDYEHYAAFRANAENIISESLDLFGAPTDLLLRYINKIVTAGASLDDVIALHIHPGQSPTDLISQQATVVFRVEPDTDVSVSWAFPIDQRDDLLLLDLVAHRSTIEALTGDEILAWMDAAHTAIEQQFLASLQPAFLEALR